ncbi:MAG: hypothetical protein ACOZBZ_03890 [Patescibacteria group bacterium]
MTERVTGLAEHYHGPREFDRVINFGKIFEPMRNFVVPLEERAKENLPGLEFLGFEISRIREIYDKITRIANSMTPENSGARFEYQRQLAHFFSFLGPETQGKFIAIKRAGSLVARFYPHVEVYEVEGKRLPMENGDLALGLIGSLPLEDFEKERIIIGEGCVATGITIAGILKTIAENEVRPKIIEVHALAVSQLGGEFLLDYARGLNLGLAIKGGMPVYAMNEVFYLMRTVEERYPQGTYAVGDAGDWSEPLLPWYDNRAWWNRGRITS